MDRTVRRIESTPSKARQDPTQAFSSYDDAANIVLLGDPGAGKTHTFRECAARTGGRYITARAFLVTPAAKFEGNSATVRSSCPRYGKGPSSFDSDRGHLSRRARTSPFSGAAMRRRRGAL